MVTKTKELKLNLGCGDRKLEGYLNVDIIKFPAVDKVVDLSKRWPWKTNSVDEIEASHILEHFTSDKRVHFINEAWRVLKEGSKIKIITPHWASSRAYGDPTHVWPPVSEWFYLYFSKEWREREAPHTSSMFKCDFEGSHGYILHPEIAARNPEFQRFAISFYKEAAQDMVSTLTKKK